MRGVATQRRRDRRDARGRGGRPVRRDRARPEHDALPRPARPRRGRLPRHRSRLDRDEHPRRLRRRRRPGSRLPAGRHRRRLRLYGRARRRAVPRGAGRPRGDGADCAASRGRQRSSLATRWPVTAKLDRSARPDAARSCDAKSAARRARRARSSSCSRRREHDDEPRPKLESHGDYVFGVFLVAGRRAATRTRVYYQEIDLVADAATCSSRSGRRRPTAGRRSTRRRRRTRAARRDASAMIAYHLVDDVAERFLDLVDALNDEIDELEDHVEELALRTGARRASRRSGTTCSTSAARSRRRATRCREVVDNRIELEGDGAVPARRRAQLRRRVRQAPARGGRPRARPRPRRRRARLPPGEDRERPERGDEAADRDRVDPARPDLHRRPLRPELPASLPELHWQFGYVLVVGSDRRHDDRPALLAGRSGAAGSSAVATLDGCPTSSARTARTARSTSTASRDFDQAVACRHCGFGFLFELMDDYYPGPNTGLVVCDREGRSWRRRRRLRAHRLPGRDLIGREVTDSWWLRGQEPCRRSRSSGACAGSASGRAPHARRPS